MAWIEMFDLQSNPCDFSHYDILEHRDRFIVVQCIHPYNRSLVIARHQGCFEPKMIFSWKWKCRLDLTQQRRIPWPRRLWSQKNIWCLLCVPILGNKITHLRHDSDQNCAVLREAYYTLEMISRLSYSLERRYTRKHLFNKNFLSI
jgi:hypothetical protein